MIKVEGLTKKYAGITAVNDLNFTVEKGEIVGFLGPNGAGKSTTMRILSCYLSATSGRASVAGFDVASQSREVRSRVGYMPENVALYPEMRVQEYLEYRAALKGVRGRRNRQRVNAVKELCNLRDVEQKLIGALSKGYRQRVGLADALLHDPDLLILDEPTIGLDPNQIRQVRQLIKDLGKRHTILLSTHILSEVEMTCSRVLIIDRGRIAASDTPEALAGRVRTAGGIRAEIHAEAGDLEKALAALPGVRKAEVEAMPDGWQGCVLRTDAEHESRAGLRRNHPIGGTAMNFFTLLNREIRAYFLSPVAWVVMFFFLLLTGFNFYAGVAALNRGPSEVTVVEAFFNTVFFWFGFVLIFPLITMRLFSEEYKMGTIEPLMTAPVRDSQVVLAKYGGALFFYIVLWLPSLLYFAVFTRVTRLEAAGAAGPFLGAYVMLLLIGMFYLAVGCLASALTRNQIVAAIMSFTVITLFFFTGLLNFFLLNVTPALRELTAYFSALEHMSEASRGFFDSRPVVFYLSLTVFVLFLTFHVFQSRRWRN
jgi:ABC-2 type transport system ATP-binding protein